MTQTTETNFPPLRLAPTIRVVFRPEGEPATVRSVPYTLGALQDLIGGQLYAILLDGTHDLVLDEEGLFPKGRPLNPCPLLPDAYRDAIYGSWFIAKREGADWVSMSADGAEVYCNIINKLINES